MMEGPFDMILLCKKSYQTDWFLSESLDTVDDTLKCNMIWFFYIWNDNIAKSYQISFFRYATKIYILVGRDTYTVWANAHWDHKSNDSCLCKKLYFHLCKYQGMISLISLYCQHFWKHFRCLVIESSEKFRV